jgi:hypothetical protein
VSLLLFYTIIVRKDLGKNSRDITCRLVHHAFLLIKLITSAMEGGGSNDRFLTVLSQLSKRPLQQPDKAPFAIA